MMNNIENVLEKDGVMLGTPVGMSMMPLLKNRTTQFVIKKGNDPKKYDVCLYRRQNGQVVLHRFYGFKNGNPVFIGDNQLNKENYTPKECILGVMTDYYRGEKKISVTKSFGYKLYVFFWCRLFVARLPYVLFHKGIHFINKRLRKKKGE